MGDPLSIIASIAGLVTISAQIARVAKSLYDSGKDAPISINKVKEEMEDMNLIFCEVQLFISGASKKPDRSRLTMISLDHLVATLSGCVLVCSSLEKTLGDVSGIAESGPKGWNRALAVERIKWALWKEADAMVVIEDLQRHKLSLSLMLNIIQCNTAVEASESVSQLHDLVEKILDSNHVLQQSNKTISVQLNELIKRHDQEPANTTASTSTGKANASTAIIECITPTVDIPITVKDDDAASVIMTATSRSKAPIESFTVELKNSRAYKRLMQPNSRRRSEPSSHSIATLDKGDSWSVLSTMSLGELSISEIAVLELPIDMADLYDTAPYQVTPVGNVNSKNRKRNFSFKFRRWSSQGGIHNAISNNNVFVLRALLNLGGDIEEVDVHGGRTPLAHAVRFENVPLCRELLKRGAKIDIVEAYAGLTPLTRAIQQENSELVTVLVDAGANIDFPDSAGLTPLIRAIQQKNSELVTVLVDAGANIDFPDSEGLTPLLSAIRQGNSELIRVLLDAGGNIDITDSEGLTPLIIATRQENSELMMVLLDAGADINFTDSEGRTPLFHATDTGDEGKCQVLLERGASVDVADSRGQTPLLCALLAQNLSICELLFKKGANINLARPDGHPNLVANIKGCIEFAIDWGVWSIVEFVLDLGVDIEERGSTSLTPLLYSIHKGKGEIAQFLITRGADPCAKCKLGRTALHYAIYRGSLQILSMMLMTTKARELVNQCDAYGNVPLHACTGKQERRPRLQKLVECLIACGASLDIKDGYGNTAYERARIANNNVLAYYLATQESFQQEREHLAGGSGSTKTEIPTTPTCIE